MKKKRVRKFLSIGLTVLLALQCTNLTSPTYAQEGDEKSYIVTLDPGRNVDQFVSRKKLDSQSFKKIGNSQSFLTTLSQQEANAMLASDEVSFVEDNALVQAAGIGKVNTDHDSVRKLISGTQAVPQGMKDIGVFGEVNPRRRSYVTVGPAKFGEAVHAGYFINYVGNENLNRLYNLIGPWLQ